MIIKKLLSVITFAIIFGNPILAQTSSSQTPTPTIRKLLRKPKSSSTSRPQMPAYNDYLTYTVADTILEVAYPANTLPATVTVSGAESGFILYTTTALREEPIDLPLESGEYTLTVTLVDERTYEGPIEINTEE